jgi:hypothetical protein
MLTAYRINASGKSWLREVGRLAGQLLVDALMPLRDVPGHERLPAPAMIDRENTVDPGRILTVRVDHARLSERLIIGVAM